MQLHNILIKPVMTEHAMRAITKDNRYTFVVHTKADKDDVKRAIETLFAVSVEDVRTVTVKGGTKKVWGKRATITTSSDFKKAVVRVKTGQSIDLFETGESKEEKKKKDKKVKNKKEEKKEK